MRRGVLLIVILVVAAACSGAVETTTTSSPAATTAPPATSSTTTTEVTTTTSLPEDTSTTTVTEPAAGWRVVDVAADDVLNVREGPGVRYAIIDEFAPDATGIVTTGNVAKIGSSMWVEVAIPSGAGWASARYLAPADPAERSTLEAEIADNPYDLPGNWQVSGVASDDVLNLRYGPGVAYSILEALAPDVTGLQSTGNFGVIDGSTWVELSTPQLGWVHGGYLTPSGSALAPCDPDENFASLPFSVDAGGSGARLVGIDWSHAGSGADYCERVVLTLNPSSAGIITVTREIDYLHVDMAGVSEVEPSATDLHIGGSLALAAYAVRSADPDRHLYVNVHFNADVVEKISVETNPVRVILDLFPGAGPPGAIRRPIVSNSLVLARQLADPMGMGSYPVEVYGYGRPFESYVNVSVTSASGDPVQLRLPDGTSVTGSAIIQATDWVDTWGEWRFTIESGPVGEEITVAISDPMAESEIVDSFVTQ